jgi:hypothetical protein
LRPLTEVLRESGEGGIRSAALLISNAAISSINAFSLATKFAMFVSVWAVQCATTVCVERFSPGPSRERKASSYVWDRNSVGGTGERDFLSESRTHSFRTAFQFRSHRAISAVHEATTAVKSSVWVHFFSRSPRSWEVWWRREEKDCVASWIWRRLRAWEERVWVCRRLWIRRDSTVGWGVRTSWPEEGYDFGRVWRRM